MPSSTSKRRPPPPLQTPTTPPGFPKKAKQQNPQPRPQTPTPPHNPIFDAAFSRCASLLDRLMNHAYGWVFNAPVDARRLGLRDYYATISDPMDLGTVKNRLLKRRYSYPLEFARDVRLTFTNAMRYNEAGDDAYSYAEELLGIFEEDWGEIEELVRPSVVSDAEKRRVRDEVLRLPADLAEEVVGLIGRRRSCCLRVVMGMVEVDFEKMDVETFKQVETFVGECKKRVLETRPAIENGACADFVEVKQVNCFGFFFSVCVACVIEV